MILPLLLVVACTPLPTCGDPPSFPTTNCATPTPVIGWDPPVHVAGQNDYPEEARLYYRESGGPWVFMGRRAAWTVDPDNAPGDDGRRYPLDAPVQRWCAACQGNALYEFAVTWANSAGESPVSAPLALCVSPVWAGGPYQ